MHSPIHIEFLLSKVPLDKWGRMAVNLGFHSHVFSFFDCVILVWNFEFRSSNHSLSEGGSSEIASLLYTIYVKKKWENTNVGASDCGSSTSLTIILTASLTASKKILATRVEATLSATWTKWIRFFSWTSHQDYRLWKSVNYEVSVKRTLTSSLYSSSFFLISVTSANSSSFCFSS